MKWNKHSKFSGSHSLLSPSSPHWIRYDGDKLSIVYNNRVRAARGSALHKLAEDLIRMKVRLRDTNESLNMFVNDAIFYNMVPEQLLFYSPNVFGTADAISFDDQVLRIHDLKTGDHPGKPDQLDIYAALFCMEYGWHPNELEIVNRIYQFGDVFEWCPTRMRIMNIMATIQNHDELLERLKNDEPAYHIY